MAISKERSQAKGFGGSTNQPQQNTAQQQAGDAGQNVADSCNSSVKTITTMKGVASANVGHYLQRLVEDRSATVSEVSEIIDWATDGEGIIADAAEMAAQKKLKRGRFGIALPSLGLQLAVPRASQYVDTSALLPPAQGNGAKQLQSSQPSKSDK